MKVQNECFQAILAALCSLKLKGKTKISVCVIQKINNNSQNVALEDYIRDKYIYIYASFYD